MYIKTLKIIPTRNTFKVATTNSYSAFLRSLLYLLKYINITSFIIMFSLSARFVHELCTQKSTLDSAYLRQQLSYTTGRPPLGGCDRKNTHQQIRYRATRSTPEFQMVIGITVHCGGAGASHIRLCVVPISLSVLKISSNCV